MITRPLYSSLLFSSTSATRLSGYGEGVARIEITIMCGSCTRKHTFHFQHSLSAFQENYQAQNTLMIGQGLFYAPILSSVSSKTFNLPPVHKWISLSSFIRYDAGEEIELLSSETSALNDLLYLKSGIVMLFSDAGKCDWISTYFLLIEALIKLGKMLSRKILFDAQSPFSFSQIQGN